jgi:PAS domain-containing protein
VLAFDGAPVTFTAAPGEFDLFGRKASFASDWVGARTPWLAIDLDGNGRIDDGRELFGSMTELGDGRRASNGFEALRALDADGDGVITAHDPAFERLLVWRDVDQDRRSAPDELRPLRDEGVVALHLAYVVDPRCIAGGCEVERALLEIVDVRGACCRIYVRQIPGLARCAVLR